MSDTDGGFSEKYFSAHKGLAVKSSPSLNYLLLYHTSPAHPPPQWGPILTRLPICPGSLVGLSSLPPSGILVQPKRKKRERQREERERGRESERAREKEREESERARHNETES